MEKPYLCIMSREEGEELYEKGRKKTFKKITAENFTSIWKDTHPSTGGI